MITSYQQTIKTYQDSAELFAAKFDTIRPCVTHITETFQAVQATHPIVVEIGCGSGKDAQEMLKRTPNYLGIDVAPWLIASAQQKSPRATFQIADVTTFVFPPLSTLFLPLRLSFT